MGTDSDEGVVRLGKKKGNEVIDIVFLGVPHRAGAVGAIGAPLSPSGALGDTGVTKSENKGLNGFDACLRGKSECVKRGNGEFGKKAHVGGMRELCREKGGLVTRGMSVEVRRGFAAAGTANDCFDPGRRAQSASPIIEDGIPVTSGAENSIGALGGGGFSFILMDIDTEVLRVKTTVASVT